MKNKLDKDYQDLVWDILRNGVTKSDRTGTGTRSVFGRMIRHNMADGFPLLTTKKMSLKNIKTELYWFLQGDTNIKFLVERGCNIWNGDSYKFYCTGIDKFKDDFGAAWDLNWTKKNGHGEMVPFSMEEFIEMIKTNDAFAKQWGELGPIYGKQWRDWDGIDQIKDLITGLLNDPDSRRLKVEAWNVSKIKKAVLPPCHTGFQCYTQQLSPEERYHIWFGNNYETGMEYNPTIQPDYDDPYYKKTPERKLSLWFKMRSVDTGLGLPYNIASYGLLLLMLCDEVNMIPGELIGSLGDTHIYNNQIEGIKEQLFREPFHLPYVTVKNGINASCDNDDIVLHDYVSHPAIKLPLSN